MNLIWRGIQVLAARAGRHSAEESDAADVAASVLADVQA